MANINDVIGTLLQNLSEARSSADHLSKQLSEEYQKDPVLRLFPIPRTEIKDIEIELKFGINAVKPRADVEVNKQARKEALIQKTSDLFLQSLARSAAEKEDDEALKKVVAVLDSVRLRDEIQTNLGNQLNQEIKVTGGGVGTLNNEKVKEIFNITNLLSDRLPSKNLFDFEIKKNSLGKFEFSIQDEKKDIKFRSEKAFETEREAMNAVLLAIDKGGIQSNFNVQPIATANNKLSITLRDGTNVVARSEVITLDKKLTSREMENVHTEFVENSGLINKLRGLKRTNAFKNTVRTGNIPVKEKLEIGSLIDRSFNKVLPTFKKELKAISEGVFDYEIDTAIDSKSLAEIPDNAISTIRLAAGISNYQWTRILHDDGTETRKLVDE